MRPSFLRLPGPWTRVQGVPERCAACGDSHLFQQPDFRRSAGLFLIGAASVATCVLMYLDANWWLIWSPMFAIVVVDRLFAATSPLAVLCYMCEHVHRGLKREEAARFPSFDLETHDRLHYAERQANS